MINSEPLSENGFGRIRSHVIGDVENGWNGHLDYFLEGYNLPEDCSDWNDTRRGYHAGDKSRC